MARLEPVKTHCDNALAIPKGQEAPVCKEGKARMELRADADCTFKGQPVKKGDIIGTFCIRCSHKEASALQAAERIGNG